MLTYEQAVTELYNFLFGSALSFYAELYGLIGKANPVHKEHLRMGFPQEVKAWEDWEHSNDQADFFLRYCGLKVPT